MALRTFGTATTTSLTGIQWFPGMPVADLAAFNALIKYQPPGQPTSMQPLPGISQGLVWSAKRGSQKLFPLDYIICDPVTGDVFVIAQPTGDDANWVHT